MKKNQNKKRSEESNRRILSAAADLFAEVGFDGARIDEIARRASISKATIYYHVGDKEALYSAVLQEVFGQAIGRIEIDVQKAHTPEDKMRAFIRNLIAIMKSHPHLAPIMIREIASGGQHLPEAIVEYFVRVIGILSSVLAYGEEEGVFIQTVPFVIYVMVMATAAIIKASRPARQRHDAIPPALKALEERLPEGGIGDEIERLVLNAITKPAIKNY